MSIRSRALVCYNGDSHIRRSSMSCICRARLQKSRERLYLMIWRCLNPCDICVELGPLVVSTSNLVTSHSLVDVLLISWVMILIHPWLVVGL